MYLKFRYLNIITHNGIIYFYILFQLSIINRVQINKKLRNLLFLCTFSACKSNKACRKIYERLVAKGKSKKLVLIAVANKLLKQTFAIAKAGRPYGENFVSKLA